MFCCNESVFDTPLSFKWSLNDAEAILECGCGSAAVCSALCGNQLTDNCTRLPFTALTLFLLVTTPVRSCVLVCSGGRGYWGLGTVQQQVCHHFRATFLQRGERPGCPGPAGEAPHVGVLDVACLKGVWSCLKVGVWGVVLFGSSEACMRRSCTNVWYHRGSLLRLQTYGQ